MNASKKEKLNLTSNEPSQVSPDFSQIFPKNFLVIMIAPTPFYSGRGTHMRIFHEAQALADRGHKITIATYHIGDKPPGLRPNIRIKRINRILFWYTKRSSGPNWQKLFLDLLLFIKVLRISIKKKPEILHGHLHEGVFIGWIVKKLLFYRKMVLIGDFHGTLVDEMRSHGYLRFGMIQKIFNRLERLIIRMPDCVFASSPGLKHAMDIKRNAPDVCVLPDAPTLSYRMKQSVEFAGNSLKPSLPSVVYTGGFTPDKGIDTLFQVISHAMKNGLVCQWVIAGGPLKMLSIPPDIQSAVKVVSPLNQKKLSELLQRVDVACDPKREEILQGSGKLLNYMYAGLPLVCFEGPAQRFYLGDELSQRLIAKDIQQFYDIIKKLLNLSHDEKQALKDQILHRSKQFTWSQSARTLEQHYIRQWQIEQK
jgi:glycosyltransferase involved in cell wall biosynthesis